MTSTDPETRTVLVLGVMWDDDGANIGVEWEITVHGATSDAAALAACADRSDTITDWDVVTHFEPGNFANSRTVTVDPSTSNPT